MRCNIRSLPCGIVIFAGSIRVSICKSLQVSRNPETFITEWKTATKCPRRILSSKNLTVISINHSIRLTFRTTNIFEYQIAWACTQLMRGIIHFFLTLEYFSCPFQKIIGINRTITSKYLRTTNMAVGLSRQLRIYWKNFIFHVRRISCDRKIKVSELLLITGCNFKSFVLNCSQISHHRTESCFIR